MYASNRHAVTSLSLPVQFDLLCLVMVGRVVSWVKVDFTFCEVYLLAQHFHSHKEIYKERYFCSFIEI